MPEACATPRTNPQTWRIVDPVGTDVRPSAPEAEDDLTSALLVRVAGGDKAAFAALYDALAARLFGVILHALADRSSSEALLQEVFLEAWRCAPRFATSRRAGDGDRDGDGDGWVLAIAHRRIVEQLQGR
jgi:RNA polymerase sigma-70 factor, ECF subfamily